MMLVVWCYRFTTQESDEVEESPLAKEWQSHARHHPNMDFERKTGTRGAEFRTRGVHTRSPEEDHHTNNLYTNTTHRTHNSPIQTLSSSLYRIFSTSSGESPPPRVARDAVMPAPNTSSSFLDSISHRSLSSLSSLLPPLSNLFSSPSPPPPPLTTTIASSTELVAVSPSFAITPPLSPLGGTLLAPSHTDDHHLPDRSAFPSQTTRSSRSASLSSAFSHSASSPDARHNSATASSPSPSDSAFVTVRLSPDHSQVSHHTSRHSSSTGPSPTPLITVSLGSHRAPGHTHSSSSHHHTGRTSRSSSISSSTSTHGDPLAGPVVAERSSRSSSLHFSPAPVASGPSRDDSSLQSSARSSLSSQVFCS